MSAEHRRREGQDESAPGYDGPPARIRARRPGVPGYLLTDPTTVGELPTDRSRPGAASVLPSLLRRLFRGDERDEDPISYDFAWMSVESHIGVLAPDLADAPDVLRREVTELAEARATDLGTGHVFDQTVGGWTREWATRIDAEHHARESILEQRVAWAEAELERQKAQQAWVNREMEAARERLEALRYVDDSPEPARRSFGRWRKRRGTDPER